MAFCSKCGNSLNEGALFCPKCGTPVAQQPQYQPNNGSQQVYQPSKPNNQQQQSYQQNYYQQQQSYQQNYYQPQNYQQPHIDTTGVIVWSVINLFLCWPLSIVSLVIANKVNKSSTQEEAEKDYNTAKTLCIVATSIGVLFWIIVALVQ